MNRFENASSGAAEQARSLALNIKCTSWSKLRLKGRIARELKRKLAQALALHAECESLRHLKAEAKQIHALLWDISAQAAPVLPGGSNGVRILQLARLLVDGGERRLQAGDITAAACAFCDVQDLQMREIRALPDALRIALCEAMHVLSGEILSFCRYRFRGESWVRSGGRSFLPRYLHPAFYAHALKLASEQEAPEMHARLERCIDRHGGCSDFLVEQAHSMAADHCLRMDNLQHLRRLLEEMDWNACFEQISIADQELHEDPAGIYSRMDDASRASIRGDAAALASMLHISELSVVRYALREAKSAQLEHGRSDPRSTVCWYLAEDAGRNKLCASLGRKCRLRCIPDAGGRKTAALVSAAVIAAAALLAWMMDNILLAVYALPLAWVLMMQLIGRIYPRYIKPRRILKLQADVVPENARTLVVLPVLLSSEGRTREMIARMETLGCLERDENIDYLLLGDFRDADTPDEPEDAAILACARQGIVGLNAVGRKKYYYLHRGRSYRAQDGRWMGCNRKRGALMDLNRLLLGRPAAREAFQAEGSDAGLLEGRYRYVVTLDGDTEYLPGTLQQLIGAMLHPLNRACMLDGRRRGYAVLQPAMLLTARACSNAYVQRRFGEGGMDGYPVMLSEFYQDITGRGCFAGKGIYDVYAFALATENVLNDDAILSHDLIEGILAGAGMLGDVFFYDGCPDNLPDDMMRQHRWIRGDWQLLPVLFSRLRINAVDRMKLLGNLLRSLYAPALLGLLVHSAWLDEPGAFAVGLLLAFHGVLVYPGRQAWKRALLDLATLPAQAFCAMDAILRTLWRLAVSRKHLMDWVPAADAGGKGSMPRIAGRACVILLLPALLRMGWIAPVLALGALFWIGVDWAQDLAGTPCWDRGLLSGDQAALLLDIARKTWRFFETHVPMDGCGLPPDNVQLDPPVGAAMRTSPTNIGLYLMSCLSAHQLGFVDRSDMLLRIKKTVNTMEQLEKWKGHLYNWYDLNALQPLRPRYVSAVDSGNLAGALLLCAHAVEEAALSTRLLRLAGDMNLAALYDAERELFFIGMDAEKGNMSRSHYDLYASESRILSYSAMMLGQVPLKHWKRLGRTFVRCGGHRALLSWSGTMFETLMPELLLRSPENTLAGQNRRGMVACQMDHGQAMGRPWGVSESGYYAFDLQLNYQYRAFGLKALALSPNAAQDVVSPYAAALALMVRPEDAAQNLRRMCSLGWLGELGMYEAADCQDGGRVRIVRSHMAHHQGMALCSICNVLCNDYLSRTFMDIPRAKALHLLLEEKIPVSVHMRHRADMRPSVNVQPRPCTDFLRRGGREHCAADVHLLHGGNTTVLANARGGIFAWKDGLQMNRFFGNLTDPHEGMYVHLKDTDSGEKCVIGDGGRVCFDAGYALYSQSFRNVQVQMRITVSPEDGAVYQHLHFLNAGKEDRILEITGCLAAALAPERDMRAHPVFQNLFVETREQEGVLLFRRRSREPGQPGAQMIYLVCGAEAAAFETSLEKLVGRTGSLGGIIADALSNTTGCVLDSCGAIRTRLRLRPSQEADIHYALNLAGDEDVETCIRRMRLQAAPQRALQLSATQTRALLGHNGIDGCMFRLLQGCMALVLDPMLRRQVMHNANAYPPVQRDALWRAGISGDLPILLSEIGDLSNLDCIRDVVRMHAFYRTMGVKMDFVLIDHHGSDYMQPARSALSDLIASSHLNGSFSQSGGAFILERRNLNSDSYAAIVRAAALRFDVQRDSLSQLKYMLDGLLTADDDVPHEALKPVSLPDGESLQFFNGYGGFDERGYVIRLQENRMPPAPWSNVLSSDSAGAIVTDRGGGFAWRGNSRHDRLTPFANNPLQEGWGWMFYLLDERSGGYVRLLPGNTPMTGFIVRHAPGESSWSAAVHGVDFRVEMRAEADGVRFGITLENTGETVRHMRLAGLVNWIMGTDAGDKCMLRCWARGGACFAAGTAAGIGVFCCDDPQTRSGCDFNSLLGSGDMMHPRGFDRLQDARGGWTLHLPIVLAPGEKRTCRFLLGGADDAAAAYAMAKNFRNGEALRRSREDWNARMEKLQLHTPDAAVNLLANGFLQAQTLNARILGRTGLYQGGGAYGFRDQLQDMLPMIHYAPDLVRRHLLRCAARQFEAGDVLHWWHEPYTGVRTRISDDLLFLPLVTAQYVRITGDADVLLESVPFLREIEIPRDREDVYAEMQPTAHAASLHRHCMLALRRAARTGDHGLCRMGSGDWNDGMNRIGNAGRGESIWLSQFLAVCAVEYACICSNEDDRAWLLALNERLCSAVEQHGWDGKWYLRAYADDGRKIGSVESECCRIDAISQAWAVLAGLDADRCRSAMDSAWENLADEKLNVIRLLHPPFDAGDFDPGYIAAYPPGVRENGAQYTHAACWMLCALIRQGDAERAHRALKMLLPINHAQTREDAECYRVEPYVMAADIYTHGDHAGRGGWSWYTGSSAWMLMAIWMLLGFERRKNQVRLNALLHDWPEAGIRLRFGLSSYALICRQDITEITLDGRRVDGNYIEMIDDGRDHIALFPPRKSGQNR